MFSWIIYLNHEEEWKKKIYINIHRAILQFFSESEGSFLHFALKYF